MSSHPTNQSPEARIPFLQYFSKEKIFLAANLFFVCTMTLKQSWANIATILLSVVFLLHFRHTRQDRSLLPYLVFSMLFFIVILAVHFFTFPEIENGLHAAEKFIPVALMPLLLSRTYLNPIGRSTWLSLLHAFAVAMTLLALYCFGRGLYNFIFLPAKTGNADNYNAVASSWNYLSYTTLSEYVGLHPTYLSIFVSFAIFIFADRKVQRYRYMSVAAGVFLLGFLFLLSSRTAILSFLVAAAVYAVLRTRDNFRLFIRRYLPIGLLAICAFVLLACFNGLLRKRLGDFTSLRIDGGVETWNAINTRLAIWKCNAAIAKENLLTGIGFESQIRDACYGQYSFYPHYGTRLNAHNQYLEFLVAGGIGLFLLFIVYLAGLIRVAMRYRETLFLVLLTLLIVNFLTECIISRANGILFMTYFSSYFMYLVFATLRPDAIQQK